MFPGGGIGEAIVEIDRGSKNSVDGIHGAKKSALAMSEVLDRP